MAGLGFMMTTVTSGCANKDPGSEADNAETDNCDAGCFSEGVCKNPPSASFCGIDGGACQTCASGQSCTNGTCVTPTNDNTGNFDPDGNANTTPPATGGGTGTTTSDPSDCDGCVNASGNCVDISDQFCGTSGTVCSADCTTSSQICISGSCQDSFDDKTYKITAQARADSADNVFCDFANLPNKNGCDPQVELKSGGNLVLPWDESDSEKSGKDSIRFNNITDALTEPAGVLAGLGTDYTDHFWCLKGSNITSDNLKVTVREFDVPSPVNEETCNVIVNPDNAGGPVIPDAIQCSGKDDVDVYIKLNVTPAECTP